jgi:rubrerythrin
MRIVMAAEPKWLCNLCGYIWPVRDQRLPPVQCARCGQRGWDRNREVVGELEGA